MSGAGRACSRALAVGLLVALAVAGLAAAPLPASATEPVTPTTLPDGFGGLVVDAAHSQVFVSSPTSGTITALDFSGTILGTITDEPGPGSMVVQGDKLYVALLNGGAIDVFDTATRARTATLGSGDLVEPRPLVFAGGKLWTSTGSCALRQVRLASVDPVTGEVTPFTVDSSTSLSYCTDLAGSPWDVNTLLAWTPWLTSAPRSRASTCPREPRCSRSPVRSTSANTGDLAVNPDGTSFVAASGSPYQVEQFRVSDLQPDGLVYPAGPFPTSVATTAAQGGLVAAGRDSGSGTDVDVYRLGQPGVDLLSRDFGDQESVLAQGLAFSADGTKLFAVTGNAFGTAHFQVLDLGTPGDDSAYGELTPLTPARLLDTRIGTGGKLGKLGAGQTFDLQITGKGGVPGAGVGAVVLNVTATEPTEASYLSAWPTGSPRPTVSNLNFTPGATVPNLVTVKVGNAGRVTIVNDAGATHVVVDVVGFYSDGSGPAGSRFHGIEPARLFDTRNGSGGVPMAKRGPASTLHFSVSGVGGVPATGVTAVVLNVTATEPTAASFLTVFPDDVSRPVASNLNVVPGQTVPNLVVVRVPANGVIDFYNNAGSTHLLADVVGYYDGDKTTNAGRLIAGSPVRLADTRLDSPFPGAGKIPGGASLLLDFSESSNLASVGAFVLNVTVTEPTAPGHVIVYPGPPPATSTSSLNFVPGLTVANEAAVRIGSDDTVGFFNSAGATHLVVDLFGIFTSASDVGAASAALAPGDITATLRAG